MMNTTDNTMVILPQQLEKKQQIEKEKGGEGTEGEEENQWDEYDPTDGKLDLKVISG